MTTKPTKKEHTASRHPAKVAKPMQRPNPERDGFNPTSVLAQTLQRNYEQRDCPLAERKDRD
jgi:hypothetical protein